MPSTKNQFWRYRWGIKSREMLYHITEYSSLWRNYSSSNFLNNSTSQPSGLRGESRLPLCVCKNLWKGELFFSYRQKKKNAEKLLLNNLSCQLPHSENKVSALVCTRWKYCMGTALQRDLSSPNLTPNFFPFKCHRPLESEFPITDSVLEHRVEGITALWLRWKCVPKVHSIQFNKMCPSTCWEQSTFIE